MTEPPEPGQRAEVLELYKLAVEMADRVSARRGTANAFFLSVQTTFIALISFGIPKLSESPWWVSLAVVLAGITLSATWWMQLRSYRDLNTAKFKVINRLEERLPVKIFADEWEELKSDPIPAWRKRYAELGTSERTVPLVFIAAHLILFVGTLTV
ncbi:RipA family octameric membrane protein [Streptomyces mirabilis]|uniref:RipA family octameric membrane protein n=1 Tax=Streptomyces mirabilis TaxID=68239 RepID=UPI0033C9AEDD